VAAMVVGYLGAVPRHERVRVPSRFKDGFMHGATARRITLLHLQRIEALQGLVRTEDQASDIPTDVPKAFHATKNVANPSHPSSDCLWYPCDRQHGILLHLYALISPRAACGAGIRRRGMWATVARPNRPP
jgi:hypothetical protein